MDSAVHSFESDGQEQHPGPLLAAERQRLGWSIGDVAAKLRMSIAQIEALERADYARLPTGTFLRGFVRSYAKLLGADPVAALDMLERAHAESRRPGIVVPSQNIKIRVPGEHISPVGSRTLLLAALALTLAAGFGYWWFFIKPGQTGVSAVAAAPKASTPLIDVQQPASAAGDAPPLPLPPPEAADAPKADSAKPAVPAGNAAGEASVPSQPEATTPIPAKPVAQAKPSKPTVPAGSGSLRFVFSGESWVEVVDGSGRTVLSRKYQGGEVEQVVGKLPLSIVIGNAPATKLSYNDVNFDLAPHTKVAVARVTLK
jgi:cytoskeleton protein RodZ